MALQMTFTYGGVTIENGYLRLTNVMIDNNRKTCSGDLVFYADKSETQAFPVNLPRGFSGVSIEKGQDPRDVLYLHIMKTQEYSEAQMA